MDHFREIVYGRDKNGKIISSTNITLFKPSDGDNQVNQVKRGDFLKRNFYFSKGQISDLNGNITAKTFMTLAFLVLGLKRYSKNCMDRTGLFGITLKQFEKIHPDFQEVLIQMIEFSWGSDCLERFFQWFEAKYKNRRALTDTISTILSKEWINLSGINFNLI